jgi:hypothetical protein
MRRAIAAVLLLLALVVSACGGSSQVSSSATGGEDTAAPPAGTGTPAVPEQSGGSALDACSLLSKAEVEAAVGGTVADGVPDVLNTCKWEKSDPAAIDASLHLLALQGAKCAVGHQGSTPVDGLSVAASWDFIEAASTGSVVACKSGWQVQVTLVGDIINHTTPEATLRGAAVQLMGLVLGRM